MAGIFLAPRFLPLTLEPTLGPYLKITFRIARNMDNIGIQVPTLGI